MGEVFLAYDPMCERIVALKRIREDLAHHKRMQIRFLREARIASQLTHPSIIPIYSISDQESEIFYTMPYVEGETLKDVLKKANQQQKKTASSQTSIPSLIRNFLNVCHAMAYAHSKGILHRDLKPENIIVGRYGEVMILDWGLAIKIAEKELSLPHTNPPCGATHPGKIVGTPAYLPPERARGAHSDISSDVYALGVILFQILTLRLPFFRPNLKVFKQNLSKEKLADPLKIAPYRDIPLSLVHIVKKALEPYPDQRYCSVEEMIKDLENYVEGNPDWICMDVLNPLKKEDWEFQAHVLLAKHIAITGMSDVMEWVSLMISHASYTGNTKIETRLFLKAESNGVGFLLSLPDPDQRSNIEEGYCLWLGKEIKLFRDNIEVMNVSFPFQKNIWYHLRIEKIDHNVKLYLDGFLILNYISRSPLMGTHLGLLFRDDAFEMDPLQIFASSQSALVSCLAIPDTFLAVGDFKRALTEYRRIGSSFKGHYEGREAMFRAGLTLLKQAETDPSYFEASLEEFEKLSETPGAPLEYLGKALVYQAMDQKEEELKCLELGLRKFPHHPLKYLLEEHIMFRLHKGSSSDRKEAYSYALLALSLLPHLFTHPDHQRLLASMRKYLNSPWFLPNEDPALSLALFLPKPTFFLEILEKKDSSEERREGALLSLFALGVKSLPLPFSSLEEGLKAPSCRFNHALLGLMIEKALLQEQELGAIFSSLFERDLGGYKPFFDQLYLWTLLHEQKWQEAQQVLDHYSEAELTDETSFLFLPYGAFLWLREGKELAEIHFSAASDLPFPPLNALASHFLIKSNPHWEKNALFWEKVTLFKQLHLFYKMIKESQKASEYLEKVHSLLQEVYLPFYPEFC